MIDSNGKRWLTAKEAAQLLGLSVWRVYHIKDKLTYRKGAKNSSRIFFLADTLFDDYLNS